MQAPPCPISARIPELSYSSSLDPAVQKGPAQGQIIFGDRSPKRPQLRSVLPPGVSNIDHSARHEWADAAQAAESRRTRNPGLTNLAAEAHCAASRLKSPSA